MLFLVSSVCDSLNWTFPSDLFSLTVVSFLHVCFFYLVSLNQCWKNFITGNLKRLVYSFAAKTVCAKTAKGLATMLENAPMWPFVTIVVFLGEYLWYDVKTVDTTEYVLTSNGQHIFQQIRGCWLDWVTCTCSIMLIVWLTSMLNQSK